MTCGRTFATCLLVVINILFLTIGIAIAAVGIILLFGWKALVAYLLQTFTSLLQPIEKAYPNNGRIDVQGIIRFLGDLLSPVSISLLVLGIILSALCVLGVVAVCSGKRRLLTAYVIITGIIFAILIGSFIYFLLQKEQIKKKAEAPLTAVMRGEYFGTGNFSIQTLIIDFLQFELQCCGFNNGSDYENGVWSREYNFTTDGKQNSIELQYPLTCCKMDRGFRPKDLNCTKSPDHKNSNIHVGCWSKMNAVILKFEKYGFYSAGTVCGFLFLLFLLSLEFFCSLKKRRRSSVKPV